MPIVDSFVLSAVGLGLAYAAVPGVVNTEALRRGMLGGFRSALFVQFGALIGDAAWATVALTGVVVLLRHDVIGLVLGLAGAGFLFRLARSAFAEAVTTRDPTPASGKTGGHFSVGLIFS